MAMGGSNAGSAVDFVHSRRSSLISGSERSSPRSLMSIPASSVLGTGAAGASSTGPASAPAAQLLVKVGYKYTPTGAPTAAAVVKDVTLRVTPQHTAGRAIDKIVKALRERYPQHHATVGADYVLVVRGFPASRIPHECPAALPSIDVVAQHPKALLMLHRSDPDTAAYTDYAAGGRGASGSVAGSRASDAPSRPRSVHRSGEDFEADSGDEQGVAASGTAAIPSTLAAVAVSRTTSAVSAAAPVETATPQPQPSRHGSTLSANPPAPVPAPPPRRASLHERAAGVLMSTVEPRPTLRTVASDPLCVEAPRQTDAGVQAVSRTQETGINALPRTAEAAAQTQTIDSHDRAQRREMFRVDAAALATELRLQRQRQRTVDAIAQSADQHLEDTLSMVPEYPQPSAFSLTNTIDSAPYDSLTSVFGQMQDPMLMRLATAVDDERRNAVATIKALHDEVQHLRHGWLVEASKVERLKECVSASAADRIVLQNALALEGREACEHIARIVRRKLDSAADSLLLELELLQDRAAFYKRKAEGTRRLGRDLFAAAGTPGVQDGEVVVQYADEFFPEDVRSTNTAPTLMSSQHPPGSAAHDAEAAVDAAGLSLRTEPQRRGVGSPVSPRMDESRVDRFLLDKIRDLEDENDVLAQRITLMETRSAVLAGGQAGAPATWLECGDEARLLTERVVQLEAELARERDLRAQYAMQGEVLKQVGINEILRQKEQLTLQRSMLASAGIDVHASASPLRHFADRQQ